MFGPLPDHPKWMYGGCVTDDGEYLLITVSGIFSFLPHTHTHMHMPRDFLAWTYKHKNICSESTAPVNRLFYRKLNRAPSSVSSLFAGETVKLIDNFDASYEYVANIGSKFWFNTNLHAPKSKIITHDLNDPLPADFKFKVVIPESKDVLSWLTCCNNTTTLVCVYLHDVAEIMILYDMDGKHLRNVDMPVAGAIQSFSGKSKATHFFFKFTSFTYPGTVFRCDPASGAMQTWWATSVSGFDASLYTVTQVFYPSKDGTRIPMFIMHHRDVERDGSNLCFLYGYGGFSISLTPSYSALRLVLLQNYRAVVAIPNLRGGAEYGEDWHNAGTLDKKQNVFDDFIAAAEYLVANKYTCTSKLAINGGSNGGLLVGACLNQRPDLYACCVADVGVLDMLRFHKFTIGHFWCSDYGNAEKSEAEFKYLHAYSPLHNIRTNAAYPSCLITTSDHDDRVVPLHSHKFTAQLQHTVGSHPLQRRPLLARIEVKAGHGAGKPTTKILDEKADVYAFIAHECGCKYRNE